MKYIAILCAICLGGCASTTTALNNIALTLGTAAALLGTASNTIDPLCAQLAQITLTVSNSGLVSASAQAKVNAGVDHYDTYCGPAALDTATAAVAATQLQADINALQAL